MSASVRDTATKENVVRRIFAPLCAAQVGSILGEQALLVTTLPLWAYDTLSSARGSSLALAAITLPALFSFPAAVSMSGRTPLDVLRASGTVRLGIVILLYILVSFPIYHAAGSFWIILLLAFGVSLADSFFMPALKAGVPLWVPPTQLLRANAWLEATDGPGWILGPLLAVWFYERYALAGPAFILLLGYSIGAATLWLLPKPPAIPTSTHNRPHRHFAALLRQVQGRAEFRSLFTAWAVGMTAAGLVEAALLPFLHETLHLAETSWGTFLGLWGLGMVLGAGLWGLLDLAPRRLLLLALGLVAVSLALFSVGFNYWVSMVLWALSGAGFVGVYMAASTILQTEADTQDSMAMLGLTHSLEAAGMLVGQGIGSVLLTWQSPRIALTVGAGLLFVTVVFLLTTRHATVPSAPVSD